MTLTKATYQDGYADGKQAVLEAFDKAVAAYIGDHRKRDAEEMVLTIKAGLIQAGAKIKQ